MADAVLVQLKSLVQQGKKSEVEQLVEQTLEQGGGADRILNEGLIPAMDELGEKFKRCEVFIPELLVAARAMNGALAKLEPALVKQGVKAKGTVVIGTVKGDLHDIGKNLVGIMLKGAGYTVVDLGADVAPEKFVQAARDANADVIGLSALLTTTMIQMKATIELIKRAGMNVPVIIGGAPVTQAYADEIGARGFAPEAASAVQMVAKLITKH